MRVLQRVALSLLVVWLLFVAGAYWLMHRPPVEFASAIGKMPGPTFMVLPFQTLWFRARAGSLQPGSLAPDFRLKTVDKSAEVRLASFRGSKPVVLIFGSYT